jgi:hypothetical protein
MIFEEKLFFQVQKVENEKADKDAERCNGW